MKKSVKTTVFMVVVMCLVMFGITSISAFATSVPEPPIYSNVAMGKVATFKNHDMSQDVSMLNYNPSLGEGDANFDSELKYNTLTDDNLTWDWFAGEPLVRTAKGVNATQKNTTAWAVIDLGQDTIINKIGIGYLGGAWIFENVLIQIASKADFTDAYTVFSTEDSISIGSNVVYAGGKVLDNIESSSNIWMSSMTNRWYVNSKNDDTVNCIFPEKQARYIRATNLQHENNTLDHTLFSEIKVFGVTGGVVMPTSSHLSGKYSKFDTIELSSVYNNANIFYTLDGSYPTTNSAKYTQPIDVSGKSSNFVLRTFAKLEDGTMSAVRNFEYSFAENIALGKTSYAKSLDMKTDLVMYNYNAENVLPLIKNTITDGNLFWGNSMVNCTESSIKGWFIVDLGVEMPINQVGVALLGGMWTFTDFMIKVDTKADFSTATTVFDNAGTDVTSIDNDTVKFNFATITARYIAVTNRVLWGGHSVTLASEITAKYAGAVTDITLQTAVKTLTADEASVKTFDYNTPLVTIQNSMPATASMQTILGDEFALDLTWSCPEWTTGVADVGEYTFKANFDLPANVVNAYDLSLTNVVTVVKINNALTWTSEPADKEYDNTAVNFLANATAGDVTYTYYQKNDANQYDALTAAPTNVGDYKLVATAPSQTNYNAASLEKVFKITAKDFAVKVTYNGDKLNTASEFPSNNKFTVDSSTIKGTITFTKTTLVLGETIIQWTFVPENKNYNIQTGEVKVDVQKEPAPPIPPTPTPKKEGCNGAVNASCSAIVVILLIFALAITTRKYSNIKK